MNGVALREIQESDLPIFFEHQKDQIANHMAAFTFKDPRDWNQFFERWSRILADEAIIKRCIVLDNQVMGHVSSKMIPVTPADIRLEYKGR